jgi:cytoskeletal protein CcmA (bactofilin family)
MADIETGMVVSITGRQQEPLTILSEADALVGQLMISGDGHLMGSFDGQVDCAGELLIGKDARIRADIRAQNVILSGRLKGNVVVKGRFEIASTGRLEGDAHVATLIVQEGGVHIGHTEVYPGGVPDARQNAVVQTKAPSSKSASKGPVDRMKKVWGELF